jgi:RNA polymerase-associated protein LEO1
MSSSNPLFADSSSDEGDDVPVTAPQEEETKTEEEPKVDKPAATETAEENDDGTKDDDDDDDDNDKEEEPAKEEKEGEENTKTARPSIFGDDDSDDDSDAEFDDKGVIEGASAPAPSKTAEAAVEATAGMTANTTTGGSKLSNKPPENVTVLQVERPDEGVSLHMTKLPNLVALQPVAFDEATYLEHEEEEQYKGYVHNMIRWRYKRNENGELERDALGGLVRESNSKLVKWDDGSFTLHIGNETFDIQTVDSSQNGFAGSNGYIHLSQKATHSNKDGEGQGAGGTVLECIGPVASRFIPKPSSLQSEAHKGLTVAVRQRTIKRAKIAEYVTEEDPEKLKADRIRTNLDEDKIRARKKANYGAKTSRHRMPGMNRRYMEEDDDEDYDTTNISAMKKGMAMEDDMDDYGDESDDDGYDDTFRGRNRKKQKRALKEEDEDEEEFVFDDGDDEDDVALAKAHTKKRSHQAVLDDDSD